MFDKVQEQMNEHPLQKFFRPDKPGIRASQGAHKYHSQA